MLRKTVSGIMLLTLSVGILALAVNIQKVNSSPDVLFFDDFNNGVVDRWMEHSGTWSVVNGEYLVTVGIVENGISTVNGLNLNDCVIETKLRFTDAVGFRAGIVFRYTDDQHYYALEISNEYDQVAFTVYTPADPGYGQPPSGGPYYANYAISSNIDYDLKVEVCGNTFTGYVNAEKIVSCTDGNYASGLVGLRARRADVHFDNFTVSTVFTENRACAQATIKTKRFSYQIYVPPREIRAPNIALTAGEQVRFESTASEPIDLYCQNSWEYSQSAASGWTIVYSHWSEKAAYIGRGFTIPTTDTWYFTFANYNYDNGVDVYNVTLYHIDVYEVCLSSNKKSYNSGEMVTLTADVDKNGEAISGIAVSLEAANPLGSTFFNQSVQTNNSGRITTNFTLPNEEGTYNAVAKTIVNNQTIEVGISFWNDRTPPVTLYELNDLWHTSDFTINLTATDNVSGVAGTYYIINNGQIQDVSANGRPLITSEGSNNTLEFWSVDNAGNEELPHKILTEIKLDKTAPTGSITIDNNATYATYTSVILTPTATDATSGVYQVRYSNDGVWDTEPWETPLPTNTWTLTSGEGTKTVYYQIKDNAGLVSKTYSYTIILDTTPPSGSIAIENDAACANTTSVTLTLSATDATSGVVQMRFSNDNVTWAPWESYYTSKP